MSAARLLTERLARNMTQQEIGRLADVNQKTISMMERGHAPESLCIAFRLARALGMTVDELFADCANAPVKVGRRGPRPSQVKP